MATRLRLPASLVTGEIADVTYVDVIELDSSENGTINGTLTAGGFSGRVTGNVTGNVTGDVTGSISGGEVNPQLTFTAGVAVTAGQLLYISGWDAAAGRYAMKLADADAADPAKCAMFVANAAADQGAECTAVGEYTLTEQDTSSASAVGDPVYLSTTAGGWTLTAPSGGGQSVQCIGVVTAKNATTGSIKLFPFYSKVVTVNTTE